MVERQVRVLRVLTQGHHHLPLTLVDDVVGFAHVTNAVDEQADVLHAHTSNAMPIGNVVAGVVVEPGAEEPGAAFACAGAIPVKAHDPGEEVLKLVGVFRGDHHHVARAALVGQETAMGAAWEKRTRGPFLAVEQFMLIADRVAKADQLTHAAAFTQLSVTTGDFDVVGFECLDRSVERLAPQALPADVGQTVDLAGMKGEAVTTIVDLEVQRLTVAFRRWRYSKAHDLWPVFTPGLEAGRFEAQVTNTDDVHENAPVVLV